MRSGQIYSFFYLLCSDDRICFPAFLYGARRNTIRPGHVHQRVRDYKMLIIM